MSMANMRKLNGLKQVDLAKKMNYSLSTIAMIEIGERKPYDKIVEIAKVLGCEVSAILKDDTEPYEEDEIIAVPSVARKHIGKPCFFGDTIKEVMTAARSRRVSFLVSVGEGAMQDSKGNFFRYIIPDRKYEADGLPRGRTGNRKKETVKETEE